MKKRLLLSAAAIAAVLAGCNEGDVAPMAAKMVSVYCALPSEARARVREQVAARIAPHSITLHCDGDPPEVQH